MQDLTPRPRIRGSCSDVSQETRLGRRIDDVRNPEDAAVPRISLIAVLYLVVGAIVAATHHYYAHLHSVADFGSAVLAILLWPLLLLGISLHIH